MNFGIPKDVENRLERAVVALERIADALARDTIADQDQR